MTRLIDLLSARTAAGQAGINPTSRLLIRAIRKKDRHFDAKIWFPMSFAIPED
jgi:hypothetical protein